MGETNKCSYGVEHAKLCPLGGGDVFVPCDESGHRRGECPNAG